MSEILSVEQLRAMANTIIEIPNFDNTGTIKIRVQKPQLLKMASQGKIPNHLLGIAVTATTGEQKKSTDKMSDKEKLKMVDQSMDLYCIACMVEPKYEDVKDILTDDQRGTIFEWAIGAVSDLDSFRNEETDGSDDNDGKEVQEETK